MSMLRDVPTPTDADTLRRFMQELGTGSTGAGRVYIAGGGSAVLYGWRTATVDLDLKLDPEPKGAFEVIRRLKDELQMNVELASPDGFIPELPGWRERSIFIARYGEVDFFHYDFYAQALAKIERGHARDLADVRAMVESRLVEPEGLLDLFKRIEPALDRYPALDARAFRAKVEEAVTLLRTQPGAQP